MLINGITMDIHNGRAWDQAIKIASNSSTGCPVQRCIKLQFILTLQWRFKEECTLDSHCTMSRVARSVTHINGNTGNYPENGRQWVHCRRQHSVVVGTEVTHDKSTIEVRPDVRHCKQHSTPRCLEKHRERQ